MAFSSGRLARSETPTLPKSAGFSLIELLVVMIIIGILAAIAIPIFLSQKQKAADTQAKADVHGAAIAEESYFADFQTYVPATDFGDAARGACRAGLQDVKQDRRRHGLHLRHWCDDRRLDEPVATRRLLRKGNLGVRQDLLLSELPRRDHQDPLLVTEPPAPTSSGECCCR